MNVLLVLVDVTDQRESESVLHPGIITGSDLMAGYIICTLCADGAGTEWLVMDECFGTSVVHILLLCYDIHIQYSFDS